MEDNRSNHLVGCYFRPWGFWMILFHFDICFTFLFYHKLHQGQESPFSDVDDCVGAEWSADMVELPAQISKPYPPKRPRKPYLTDPKKYGDSKFIASLDYQWFDSESLCCYGVLEMVDEREIFPFYACPNEYFPSDHLPIMSKYKFM